MNGADLFKQNISGFPTQSLCNYILCNPTETYLDSDVVWLLQHDLPEYSKLFYTLSISNSTLHLHSFKTSFLYKNFQNFSEKELMYICEGLKLQIERGQHDFHYISHHLFNRASKSPQLRSLLLHIMSRGDYRARELLLTHGYIEGIIDIDASNVEQRVFLARFVKHLIELDNGLISAYLKEKKISIKIPLIDGCTRFFLKWMEEHGDGYRDIVVISIKD